MFKDRKETFSQGNIDIWKVRNGMSFLFEEIWNGVKEKLFARYNLFTIMPHQMFYTTYAYLQKLQYS